MAESYRIRACKEGPCMACSIWHSHGLPRCDYDGCDYHHMKSGNMRRGHEFGVALCLWHHRAHPLPGLNSREMREKFGPSLMDGSRLFHETYGSDDELLAKQNEWLGGHK